MLLRDFLQSLGLTRRPRTKEEILDQNHKNVDNEYKTRQLEEEYTKALQEVEKALHHQKQAAHHISGVAQKQVDDAELALRSLRGMLRRSLGDRDE